MTCRTCQDFERWTLDPYPLSTVGMALHMAATKVIRIASVADKPVTKTELAVDQPATVTRSENQYQVKAQPD